MLILDNCFAILKIRSELASFSLGFPEKSSITFSNRPSQSGSTTPSLNAKITSYNNYQNTNF